MIPADRLDAAARRLSRLAYDSRFAVVNLDALAAAQVMAATPPALAVKARTIVCSPPYYGQRTYDGVGKTFWGRESAPRNLDPRCWWESPDPAKHWYQEAPSPMLLYGDHNTYGTCLWCRATWVQLGLEPTPSLYVEHLVRIFRACRDILTDDGTLWVVIGDSYSGSGRGPSGAGSTVGNQAQRQGFVANKPNVPVGMKPKDLMDIPHELGRALRADGWYWRADIIWLKQNGIGSNALDRPSHIYENVLLFSKSRRYFYNPAERYEPGLTQNLRLIRDVWEIPVGEGGENHGHTAGFPVALADRCIRLGSEPGDWVCDPFSGSGTTGVAALGLNRSYLGFEPGQDYAKASVKRLQEVLA